MLSPSIRWVSGAESESTDWTSLTDDPRNVAEYDKLIITVRCITAPANGVVRIKIQHSFDYDAGIDSPHWEDLIIIPEFGTPDSGKQHTQTVTEFHSQIRAVAQNSDADESPTIAIYIRER